MTFIPVTIHFPDRDSITIVGEQVTEHFAITPEFGKLDNGEPCFRGSVALTHIPTGRLVSRSTWVDLRAYAVELEKLPIDWANFTKLTSEESKVVKETHSRIWNDEHPGQWPNWAGDASTPALSTLVEQLDHAIKRNDVRTLSKDLANKVAELDAELGKKIDIELVWRDCAEFVSSYGVIYLLAVLHRVDPIAADRAARDLVGAWDAGDSMDEWVYQWRKELADGVPLTLYGFADLPILTEASV